MSRCGLYSVAPDLIPASVGAMAWCCLLEITPDQSVTVGAMWLLGCWGIAPVQFGSDGIEWVLSKRSGLFPVVRERWLMQHWKRSLPGWWRNRLAVEKRLRIVIRRFCLFVDLKMAMVSVILTSFTLFARTTITLRILLRFQWFKCDYLVRLLVRIVEDDLYLYVV